MILHLKGNIEEKIVKSIASELHALRIKKENQCILVTSSQVKNIPEKFNAFVTETFVFDNDMQLSSREYIPERRLVSIGKVTIGDQLLNTVLIAGPCSVESGEMIEKSALLLKELGLSTLRAGTFKSRTSPYSFQGLGLEGLKLLEKIRNKYGLNIVSEVIDSTHVDHVIDHADVIQIGARSMYNHGVLKKCGKVDKPVLLKRAFGATLQEFIQAAEFILSGGNEKVILCERGIRTFETKTRFTLDLCGVSYLKEHTNLPIVLDPSHAMGFAWGVADLARASMAMGVEGIMIETHPQPEIARSDAQQQLNHDEFRKLYVSLQKIADAIGRKIV
jgi:3-deoxy-7-phosphoheptulonate synthase